MIENDLRLLLAVDGSAASARATRALIESVRWLRRTPHVDVLTVSLPLPHVGGRPPDASLAAIDAYLEGVFAANLAPSTRLLDEADLKYRVIACVGFPAGMIAQHARRLRCHAIYMGTRGRSPASAAIFGSVATDVLRLAACPVVLVK